MDICFILLFQMLNMPSKHDFFWNWGPYWTPIEDKNNQIFDGPSITHKDDHFQKTALKLNEK